MPKILNAERTSGAEAEKLIEEMKELIKTKGLGVELVETKDAKLTASGCTGCTLCPCMICW